jgi:leader peptidase (prepilin peptidase)/N-methyltransferase
VSFDGLAVWGPLLISPFIGSFLGVLIARVPMGRGVVAGRSACASCGTSLTPLDLVPLLSFVFLRGRCRHCGAPIPKRDVVVELAAITVALAATLAIDPAFVPWGAGLGWVLIALTGIDFCCLRLPDFLTLPLLLAGLIEAWWLEPDTLTDRAVAAALGYLLFRAIGETYRYLRGRAGLGEGDAKLLAAGGAWLGSASLPYVVLIAAFGGLIFAGGQALRAGKLDPKLRVALGPFLAAGIFAVWIWRVAG